MYQILIKRHISYNRHSYTAMLIIFISAFIYGVVTGNKIYEANSFWSVMIASLLPAILISFGGLFFMGVILIFAVLAYMGYVNGAFIAGAFNVSFGRGLLYVFFILLPCLLPRLIVFLYMAVSSYNCDRARILLRRKGLSRKMNSYEIGEHLGKTFFVCGVLLLLSVLEFYVFAEALFS